MVVLPENTEMRASFKIYLASLEYLRYVVIKSLHK